MTSSLVRHSFLLVMPAVLLLMGVMACGGEEPAPIPTPVNISAIVQQALESQPQGVTADDMANAIQSALAAQPGVSTQDVASEVAKVLLAQPGATTEDVASAIASALEARPGVTTQDVATEIARALRAQQPGVTEEQVRAHYDAFHNRAAALRFARFDVAAEQEQEPELSTGLLRPHAAEILLLHDDAAAFGPEQWHLMRRLAVPGGLALVCHDDGAAAAPDAGDAAEPDAAGTTPPADGDPVEPARAA